jgi:hypothetical protein
MRDSASQGKDIFTSEMECQTEADVRLSQQQCATSSH